MSVISEIERRLIADFQEIQPVLKLAVGCQAETAWRQAIDLHKLDAIRQIELQKLAAMRQLQALQQMEAMRKIADDWLRIVSAMKQACPVRDTEMIAHTGGGQGKQNAKSKGARGASSGTGTGGDGGGDGDGDGDGPRQSRVSPRSSPRIVRSPVLTVPSRSSPRATQRSSTSKSPPKVTMHGRALLVIVLVFILSVAASILFFWLGSTELAAMSLGIGPGGGWVLAHRLVKPK